MKLTVAILTYNQEQYICEALDSVLMQEVNFDYEIVVGDDCSKDSTPAILQEYAARYSGKFNLILNTENVGISKNYQNVLYACQGEYIALLEGDDYWTDKTKLQKSVDFLDAHPDYGFVGAYNTLLYPDGHFEKDAYDYFPEPQMEGNWELHGDVFEYTKFGGPATRTVTICFRKSVIIPYMHYVGLGTDSVLQCVLSHDSKFAKYRDEWAVYRQGGVSTSRMSLEKSLYYTRWFVDNLRLMKKIYPTECDFDEEELEDRITYVQLKHAVRNLQINDAILFHGKIKSAKYKKKNYYILSKNGLLCLAMGLACKNGLIK